MPEEELPRRYIAIRRQGARRSQPVSAVVRDRIPGREDEVWLTHVRPTIRLDCGGEEENIYALIGKVHAALEGAGLLSRAQRFVAQAYYLGDRDEVLRLAAEYVEVENQAP
ncbi:MAG: hypothetical protein M3305_05085 [Actinomycetota bacterium]|nr:hypothetical protein [Actinomycetota bacterium]